VVEEATALGFSVRGLGTVVEEVLQPLFLEPVAELLEVVKLRLHRPLHIGLGFRVYRRLHTQTQTQAQTQTKKQTQTKTQTQAKQTQTQTKGGASLLLTGARPGNQNCTWHSRSSANRSMASLPAIICSPSGTDGRHAGTGGRPTVSTRGGPPRATPIARRPSIPQPRNGAEGQAACRSAAQRAGTLCGDKRKGAHRLRAPSKISNRHTASPRIAGRSETHKGPATNEILRAEHLF
jgi:hypothetical protein